MAEEQTAAAQGAADKSPQQFALQRIYLKDLSFEAPQGAGVFRKQWKPHINQDLNTKASKVEDDLYEVVLSLTITVKQEDETAFLVEVHQAGLFTVKGLEGAQLGHVLSTLCPNILFPYARESIDSVVTKGSFPALMLPPINFEALYAQAMAQAKQNTATEGSASVN